MIRLALLAASTLALATVPAGAATHCRDAHGKFIKCTEKKPAKPVRCKDAKGHFAKCGTPGAKPM